MAKWALPALGLFLMSSGAQAQDEVGEFIRAGRSDANKLIQAYAEPVGKSLGHSLNGGWFNSGKAMGLGRFDIRVFGSVTFAPKDAKTFDLAGLGLQQVRDANGNKFAGRSVLTPTIFGEDKDGPGLTVYARNPVTNQEERISSFNAPPGTGVDFMPFPVAQLSVGLIKDTEVAVRFVPEIKMDDFEISLWGVGVKHGIKQWIPVVASIPGFDITVFGGYTNLKSAYRGIDVGLADEDQAFASAQQRSAGYYDGQAIELTTKAWTVSLVASKTFSVITGYAGPKYSNVQTDLAAIGKYPVTAYKTTAPFRYVEDVDTPVNISMKDSQFGLTAGLRLKLLFFSMYGEYTLAKYPTATAGIGLGWN